MVGGINVDGAREDFLATAGALSQKMAKRSHHGCQPLEDHLTSSKLSLHVSVQSPSIEFLQDLITHLLTASFRGGDLMRTQG